jgi:serine/threonine protein kinase
MELSPGTKLGPYEIEAAIGAGGMGEVYRARDTRLERVVAIKLLPTAYGNDAERLSRFEQETRAVAALNHPNILAIYDVGTHNGTPFLVSELLKGESLRPALDRGPLPQRKVIEYGVQIAQGLAAAHDKGIVHRDLKPENVFVTHEGRVKILDFGLAKLAAKAASAEGVTLTMSHTAAGVVMGTASYMAPEQVRGGTVDARTDIFAFGAVLYEMLAGQRAFRRDTLAETMTSVLNDDPAELTGSVRPISPALDKIVRRCLEKDPNQRFHSAKDLSFALSALSGTDTNAAARSDSAQNRKNLWPYAVAALIVALAGALGFAWLRPTPRLGRQQFAIPVPGDIRHLAISADGVMLAFVSFDENSGQPMLWIQRIGSPTATLLPGTDGASYPFWSPDHESVGYFAHGNLEKINFTGGAPQVLARVVTPRGGSWGKKNVILYAPMAAGVLWRIHADGSGAAPLTSSIARPEEQSHRWPHFLPDGEHFPFWAGNFANRTDDRVSGIYFSSLAAKSKKLVLQAHSNPEYAQGYMFYADAKQQMVRVKIDESNGSVTGETEILAPAVGYQPSTYLAAFTAAEKTASLVYSSLPASSLSQLTWYERSGKELGHVGDPAVQANPTISPRGDRVAVDRTDLQATNVDVWIASLRGGTDTRFTFDASEEVIGVWSHDGASVAYRGVGLKPSVYLKKTNGLERERRLFSFENMHGDVFPNAWTPDDKFVLCTMSQDPTQTHGASMKLMLVPVDGGVPVPFTPTEAAAANAQISPDGKWTAYASNESGSWEVYVTSFPSANGKWQVSRGGGTEPRWRADGSEIFYMGPLGMLTAVKVSTDGISSTGTPAPLFSSHGRPAISATDIFSYDVAADGATFLVNR